MRPAPMRPSRSPRRTRYAVAVLLLLPAVAACSSATGGKDAEGRTPTPSLAPPSGTVSGPHGRATATVSDFNGDGFGDLVVAAPATEARGRKEAGAVVVLYGGEHGIEAGRRRQTLVSVGGTSVPARLTPLLDQGHRFGDHVTAADLDGDGHTDLAVSLEIGPTDAERARASADGEGHPGRYEPAAGPVTLVLWGSRIGLAEVTMLPSLGRTAAGDFDGDGQADLVASKGARVLYGPFGRDGEERKSAQLTGRWGDSDQPRRILAGDLNGDGRDDLVTSQGFEEMSYPDRFYAGGKDGLGTRGKDLGTYGLGGAIGDFDCDGYADLAAYDIGKVSEDAQDGAGRVRVLPGGPDGPGGPAGTLTAPGGGRAGDHSSALDDDQGDRFGAALSAADADGDGCADLAVGAPGTNGAAGRTDSGAVYLFQGVRGRGLGPAPVRTYTQDSAVVPGTGERGDRFGSAVAFLPTGESAPPALAVGAPGEDGAVRDSGAVWVITGPADAHPRRVTSFGPAAVQAPEKGGTDGTPGTGFGAALQ
ncbi:FG-GAP-like repeat-containing protein [Streptomyces sp. VRA16 Mangrove soil]|uniref:FG-GAP-like repeat-containing protein n=1 Tax=Streptomyces sp. VRA16 Mangrove soil TaxID=2817434 RepID=UPI001A9DA9F2|nr:integrin alpha [Streptomyces sp. VRA16 Mangrove soil]MBO1337129.1 FG-GAP repeat protein [Streptomyces sp. VRA16 Mangrove soil]